MPLQGRKHGFVRGGAPPPDVPEPAPGTPPAKDFRLVDKTLEACQGVEKSGGEPNSKEVAAIARERLLILEPEELVRWSLVTYLAKWFEVRTAESPQAAIEVLDRQRVDALVVSDDLSETSADRLVSHALTCNPRMRIVRMVANPHGKGEATEKARYIEKPFQLDELASLLMP